MRVNLGCYITEQIDPDKQIETAHTTFMRIISYFCNDNLNLKLRKRIIKGYIWSVLLYGAETWTLKDTTINCLEVLKMWLHRRMVRIPWTATQL